jgi:hypothetical protein
MEINQRTGEVAVLYRASILLDVALHSGWIHVVRGTAFQGGKGPRARRLACGLPGESHRAHHRRAARYAATGRDRQAEGIRPGGRELQADWLGANQAVRRARLI